MVEDNINKFHVVSIEEIKKELLTVHLVSIEEACQMALWVEQYRVFSTTQCPNDIGSITTSPPVWHGMPSSERSFIKANSSTKKVPRDRNTVCS